MRYLAVLAAMAIIVSSVPFLAVHSASVGHASTDAVNSGYSMSFVNHTVFLGNSSTVDGSVSYYSQTPGPVALAYARSTGTFYAASGISSILVINATGLWISQMSSGGDFPSAVSYVQSSNEIFTIPGINNLTAINLTTGAYTNVSVGAYPQGMAYDSSTSTMFVAVQGNGSHIVAVNTSAMKVEYRISLGNGPFGMAYDQHNGFIYTTFPGAGYVSVFNPAKESFVKNKIPVGGSPYDIAVNPYNNTLYVTNQGLNDVNVINGNTQAVSGSMKTGKLPSGLAFSTYGDNLVVANTDSSNVTVLNAQTGRVVQWLAAGSQPLSVAASPDGEIMVGDHGSNSITVISPVTHDMLTFREKGLPPGTLWNVTVNGVTRYSQGSSITFNIPPGTASYSVFHYSGHYTSASGKVDVNGNTVVGVDYHSSAALRNEIISVAVLGAVVVIIAGIYMYRRRRP